MVFLLTVLFKTAFAFYCEENDSLFLRRSNLNIFERLYMVRIDRRTHIRGDVVGRIKGWAKCGEGMFISCLATHAPLNRDCSQESPPDHFLARRTVSCCLFGVHLRADNKCRGPNPVIFGLFSTNRSISKFINNP